MNQEEIKDFVKNLTEDEKRNLLGELLKYHVEGGSDISPYVGYPLSYFDWEVLCDDLFAFRRMREKN
jgi:hypothetical protein